MKTVLRTAGNGPQRNSKDIRGNGSHSEAIFFYAFNFLVIPFSGGMTYRGFDRVLDPVLGIESVNIAALFIAIITSLFFLAINFNIRENRLKGKPHRKQTLMYFVPLVFSTLGNFSAFYGDAMRGYWIKAEVDNYMSTVEGLNDKLRRIVSQEEAILDDIENQYNRYLASMDLSNADPDEPGAGRIVRGYWARCKLYFDSIGIELTPFPEGGANFVKSARRYSDMAFASYKKERMLPYNCAMSIDTTYMALKHNVMNINSLNDYKQSGCELLDTIVLEYNTMKTNACFGNFGINVNSLPVLHGDPCSEFKTVGYLMEDAFVTVPKPINTFLFALMALLLDLSSLLYVLIFVNPPRPPGPKPIPKRR